MYQIFKNPQKLMLAVILALILVIIFQNSWLYFSSQSSFKEQEQRFPHLSKRILSENPNDLLINFLDLRRKLREEVKPYGQDFAFYFEYLPTGTSVGVNEKIEFQTGSLFKVPVVMAYFHKKERLGITEDKVVTLEEKDIDSRFGNLWQKGAGAKINLNEAVRLSLVESDNTAVNVLLKEPELNDYEKVYEGLDLDLTGIDLQEGKGGAIITVKQFSSILKALFFSAVLSKDNSELILHYLSNSVFEDMLAAGVPKNVPIAHKIGVFGDSFMDCGIVYVPHRSYLLCMRSKSDQNTAEDRMKKISSIVYEYVSTAKTNE